MDVCILPVLYFGSVCFTARLIVFFGDHRKGLIWHENQDCGCDGSCVRFDVQQRRTLPIGLVLWLFQSAVDDIRPNLPIMHSVYVALIELATACIFFSVV